MKSFFSFTCKGNWAASISKENCNLTNDNFIGFGVPPYNLWWDKKQLLQLASTSRLQSCIKSLLKSPKRWTRSILESSLPPFDSHSFHGNYLGDGMIAWNHFFNLFIQTHCFAFYISAEFVAFNSQQNCWCRLVLYSEIDILFTKNMIAATSPNSKKIDYIDEVRFLPTIQNVDL